MSEARSWIFKSWRHESKKHKLTFSFKDFDIFLIDLTGLVFCKGKIPKSLKEKVYAFSTHTANFKKFVNAPQTSDWPLVFFIRKVYVWSFKENWLQAPMCLPKIRKTRVYFCINIFSEKRVRTYIESDMPSTLREPPDTIVLSHLCDLTLFSCM